MYNPYAKTEVQNKKRKHNYPIEIVRKSIVEK